MDERRAAKGRWQSNLEFNVSALDSSSTFDAAPTEYS